MAFYGSVFVIWLYLQKAMYRPCDLDLWPMKVNIFRWIEYNAMSILYTFQINISSNSRVLLNKIQKYWPDTHADRHTHRQTDRQGENNTSQPPPGDEVNISKPTNIPYTIKYMKSKTCKGIDIYNQYSFIVCDYVAVHKDFLKCSW